jgi:hypothetical protein
MSKPMGTAMGTAPPRAAVAGPVLRSLARPSNNHVPLASPCFTTAAIDDDDDNDDNDNYNNGEKDDEEIKSSGRSHGRHRAKLGRPQPRW